MANPNPTLYLENQFGEVSQASIFGGSNQINCNFIVDSTNGNGLGIRTLKGAGVLAVYMNTSATPAAGNPNPAAGYILVELAQPYSGLVAVSGGQVSPVSGTPINVTSGVTAGQAYVITSVGTTSAAQWQVLGLPATVTPNVGAGFIAIASTTATGSGVVEVPLATGSKLTAVEVIGDPNQTCNVSSGGAFVLFQCLAATSSGVTTQVATAPAPGTVISLQFCMNPLPNASAL